MTCPRLEIKAFLRSEIPSDLVVEKIMGYYDPRLESESLDILHQIFDVYVVEEILSYVNPRICLAMLINIPMIPSDDPNNLFSISRQINNILTTIKSAIKSGIYRQVIIALVVHSNPLRRKSELELFQTLVEELSRFDKERKVLPMRIIQIDLKVEYAYGNNEWKTHNHGIFIHSMLLVENCAYVSEFIHLVEPGDYINVFNIPDFQQWLSSKTDSEIFQVSHCLMADTYTYSNTFWKKGNIVMVGMTYLNRIPSSLMCMSSQPIITVRN